MRAYRKRLELSLCTGNNAFSFEKRRTKKLSVARLIQGDVLSIREGKETAFCEYDEDSNADILCHGVCDMLYDRKRNLYLFDNHNHSFYFIYQEYLKGKRWDSLVHVDQHKDSREPALYFENFTALMEDGLFSECREEQLIQEDSSIYGSRWRETLWKHSLEGGAFIFSKQISFLSELSLLDEEEKMDYFAWLYTNYILNVGNFILPIYKTAKFDRYYCVDSTYKMREVSHNPPEDFVLDLDLDFFSRDMDYIPMDEKIDFVKELIDRSKLVMIATSPFFIEFERCKRILNTLFE